MALRNIVFSDDERIRKISKPVRAFDENLDKLLDDMKETMRFNDGVGLAAIQVGVLRRCIVVEACGQVFELVNPEIIESFGTQIGLEGCLSVKGVSGEVERPYKVTVKAQTRYGEEIKITAEALLAVVLCHEIDHLDGIIFTDKMIRRIEDI